MTVKEAVEEFLLYLGSIEQKSPNTVKAYRNDLERFENDPEIGQQTEIKALTSTRILNCVSRFKAKPSTYNRYVSAVRSLFAYCKKMGEVNFNPALEVKRDKIKTTLPKFLTGEEINEFRRKTAAEPILWKKRDRALIEVMYSSGCRLSEVAGLRVKDFSHNFMEALVCGKGSKYRVVYFESYVVELIQKYLAERNERFKNQQIINPKNFLFVNQKGEPLSRGGIAYILTRYSGPAGTKRHINPHALRHTFATAMLTGGADIRNVQELLGHSSISTTQKYTHVSTDHMIYMYNNAHPHGGNKK